MSQPARRKANTPRPHRSGDHRIVVFSNDEHVTDMARLAETLLMNGNQAAAEQAGRPAPHLARLQKLSALRHSEAAEEADDE